MKIQNIFLILFIFIVSQPIFAKESWIIDKELSTINFELPVFLAKNVKGEFKEIEGLVEIDVATNINNKAVFSVEIKSIEMNYEKYKELLLSEIFFYEEKFPIALIDTRQFSYENQESLDLMVELNIKGIVHNVPIELQVIRLAEKLVQIKSKLTFSRTDFKIGVGKWSSTAILKDNAKINTNLFLFKN